jgi:DNA-binding NarL/FixJ family response regulator
VVDVTLRVVIAEDSVLMREGITAVLALHDDIELVATCSNYDELIQAVPKHLPDVVLTDIRMPPTQTDEGIRAANDFRETHPDMGVVVLSQYVEPGYAMRLFESGSNGRAYLLKERVGDPDELYRAIQTVNDGGSVIDPKVVEALIDARRADRPTVLDRLTERENEVLAQMAQGGSNAAIGDALFISPRSVEKHINSIFTKLDLPQDADTNRRVQAVLVYLSEANV